MLTALNDSGNRSKEATWYGQNVDASITFKRDGTWKYSTGSTGSWDVLNDSVIEVHGTDKDGNQKTYNYVFNDNKTELVNGEDVYKLTKPKS